MRDVWKWKLLGYPAATLTAHFTSSFTSGPFGNMTGLSPFLSEAVVVAGTGLFVGIVIEEIVPHYLHDVRGGSGGGGGDIGGDLDGGGDLNL